MRSEELLDEDCERSPRMERRTVGWEFAERHPIQLDDKGYDIVVRLGS